MKYLTLADKLKIDAILYREGQVRLWYIAKAVNVRPKDLLSDLEKLYLVRTRFNYRGVSYPLKLESYVIERKSEDLNLM
jgi:hypothetical protein